MTEAPSTLRKRPAPEDINTSCSSQRHRTILFKDLEQGEEAYKHRILREVYTNPSDRTVSGSFWILKCDLHNRHFCAKSDVGNKKSAEKHLPEHRDGYKSSSASRTRVFECFGFAVKGCEDHQVLEYNRRVEANIAERLHEKKTQRRSGRQRWTVTDTRDSSTEVAQVNHSGTFVENPEPGQLYIVLWRSKKERTKRPFAGLMLPMGDFNDIGIRGNFEQSGLSDTIPPCYNPRREGEGNPGWSKSYEDGGKRLANRKFPFLCFDHETDLQRCSKVWIAAKNIQPYDADGYNQKYRILAEDIRQWHKPAPSTNQGN